MKENLPKTDSLRMENVKRASLSWRLTSREKASLINNINTSSNRAALKKLQELRKEKHCYCQPSSYFSAKQRDNII
ncbi:hypothetical protein LVD15_25325 [Fulvivirga maritima]|uniref:hypothetical protein n=1 Tax=Fulvivirga maritima TaxID=2904247 RepID=UPI001F3834FA|nr:hypothetical protein [Fulvivirga maritima]UII26578.1 hypothetical protein LVD15_25325 [Fulvivirga maritima]